MMFSNLQILIFTSVMSPSRGTSSIFPFPWSNYITHPPAQALTNQSIKKIYLVLMVCSLLCQSFGNTEVKYKKSFLFLENL